MVICFLKYILDPLKVNEFEQYGKMWIDLVNEIRGIHHGYLIPHEGSNNIGYASFFISVLSPTHPKCQQAFEYAKRTGCIISYERTFMKPVFSGLKDKARLE